MLPEAKSQDLLYVSTDNGPVNVYAYKSRKLVGSLTGLDRPIGQCVDAVGDVWITDGATSQIVEYAHGGSQPLKTLSASGSELVGCSVSPNGDLAVADQAGIEVFTNASGSSKTYSNERCQDPQTPGYDNNGNLYVEGFIIISGYLRRVQVCELPAGGKALKAVRFSLRHFRAAGSVMWDGEDVALAADDKRRHGATISEIFRVRESPSGDLTIIGVTRLTFGGECQDQSGQFFIVGKKNPPLNDQLGTTIINPQSGPYCDVLFGWKYPRGGAQLWSLSVTMPNGASVSLAPSN